MAELPQGFEKGYAWGKIFLSREKNYQIVQPAHSHQIISTFPAGVAILEIPLNASGLFQACIFKIHPLARGKIPCQESVIFHGSFLDKKMLH